MSSTQAEAHYQQAVLWRQKGDAQAALDEITKAIAIENQAEYYFERAWAQVVLADVEEAEKSLEMIAAISNHRPCPRVQETNVASLWRELALLKGRIKSQATLFKQALEDQDPEAILTALTPGEDHGLSNLLRASLRLHGSSAYGAMGQSKFGGQPDLPSDFDWPEGHDGVPLAFLCQLNLAALNIPKPSPLPASGLLYFFYEAKEQPWGFEPEDKGQWKVIYIAKQVGLWGKDIPEDLPEGCLFAPIFLKSQVEVTLPDGSDEGICALGLSQPVKEIYTDALENWYGKEPWHRLLGNPQPIQAAMQIECEMVANGIDPASGYNHPNIASIASGAQQWRLLLQLDSDAETGMTWGDGGRLYFWIRQQDLKIRNFDDVWLILQCY